MALDPLAPVREAFVRMLDNARPLQELDPALPVELTERATVGLVAVGMSDLPAIAESARSIEELLLGRIGSIDTEFGRRCQDDSVLIRSLVGKLSAPSR